VSEQPSLWRRWAPYLLLAAVELLAFGVFIPFLGFYHDDWANLFRLEGHGLWENLLYFTRITPDRPLNILQYPLLFAFGGLHPRALSRAFVSLEIPRGLAPLRALLRLFRAADTGPPSPPSSSCCSRPRITMSGTAPRTGIVTLDLTLLGLLFHLRWCEDGGWRELLLGQLCYVLGVLKLRDRLLPARSAPLRPRRTPASGGAPGRRDPPESREGGAALSLEPGLRAPGGTRHGAGESSLRRFLGRALLQLLRAGLECISNRVLHVCAVMSPVALDALTWKAAAAALLVGGGAAWSLRLRAEDSPRRPLLPVLAAGLAGALAAILPYALSRDYTPAVFGS